MAKNTSKRKKDIKSKLIAAICMLLVSTIMMVSSTYAWFTLSTAPEVKGITTTIGSNGALEIALSPQSGLSSDVKDATLNDANALYTVKNLTWGNLLDLSDSSYNLSSMTLSPTVLLAATSGDVTKLDTAPLGTPTYGSDGRISGLNTESTMIAGLNEGKTGYVSGGDYGVRAVGSASGMSTQQLGFKSNLAAISNYATKATDAASASISANGSALASMLVQHARADGTDNNDYAQYVPALVELTTALDTSVTNMKEAVRAALMAAAATEDVESVYATTIESIKAADWDALDDLAEDVDGLGTVVGAINAIEEIVSEAKSEAAKLQQRLNDDDDTNNEISWDDAGPVLTCLMDTTDGVIEVNGDSIDELKSNMNDTDYIVDMVSDGIVITLGKDSGVYYDIAEVAGNITATTTATVDSGTSLGKVTLHNVVIKTVYSGTSLLPGLKTYMNENSDEGEAFKPAGNSGTAVMDTFYGYVIDLMFRTNAADSKLLLQTEAAQRVYDDSNNADTLGGGATLTFTNISSANANSVKGLVQSIRIVFFDPSGETIYGIAKATSVVTTENSTTTGEGDDAVTTTTYTITGRLELCAYTVDPTTNQVTVGDALTDSDLNTTYNDGAVLCELSQNVAKAVSCLVYLDGTDVTNADVLYNADVLGALNLQFASSVNLEPMDNAELFNGTTAAADSD